MLTITSDFFIDGKPFKLISGSIHYFRTVPEYWRDRLEKLKNLGCNTVETYIPWNFHEPKKGHFRWEGRYDVEKFISLAEELDLYIIIRPSPYICAEWEWGGLPSWLLADSKMKVRSNYKGFISQVERYYKELMPRLVPHQADRGGKIILMQVENEYGYFGTSKKYLHTLANLMRSNGITVPFVTSDGPWGGSMGRGSIKEALPTGNFGSKVSKQFKVMKKYVGKRPLVCMEFWCGWFDAWGEKHHTSNLEQNKKDLADALQLGHLNFYMFEGGTNFGFTAGKNLKSKEADITSYDYDAVLSEDGQITPKYEAFKKIIRDYEKNFPNDFTNIPEVSLTTEIKRRAYGEFSITSSINLFDTLEKISHPIRSPKPLNMEDPLINQDYGYILYRFKCEKNTETKDIQVKNARDKTSIFIKENTGIVIVENQGRENFGLKLNRQRKGIQKNGFIKCNGKKIKDFEIFSLNLDEDQISKISFPNKLNEKDFFRSKEINGPAFHRFDFSIDEACDTFLDCTNWTKGVAFVNGFNIGRYWNIGPQTSLYIPGPLLRKGENSIIIYEEEKPDTKIRLLESHNWK